MKKTVKIVAGLVVLVVAAALIAPYFIGRQVEQRFRERVAEASGNSDLSLAITDYDLGWFRATATFVVIRNDTRIVFDNDINHGPLPGLTWATIVSRPQIDSARALEPLFANAPLTLTAELPLFGDGRFNVESPAARGALDNPKPDGEPVHVVWDGLTGHLSDRNGRATLDVRAPSLIVESRDTQLVIADMQIHGTARSLTESSVPDDPVGWQSKGTVSLGQFRLKNKQDGRELSFDAEVSTRLSTDDADQLDYRTQLTFNNVYMVGFDQTDPSRSRWTRWVCRYR